MWLMEEACERWWAQCSVNEGWKYCDIDGRDNYNNNNNDNDFINNHPGYSNTIVIFTLIYGYNDV